MTEVARAVPPVLRSKAALRAAVGGWQAAGEVVGVVPTMGALHEGHLSLVRAAEASCDRVVVTIFVNPAQFNNPSDLESYPRTEEADAEKLSRRRVDAIYAPPVSEIYPEGFCTTVSVAGLTDVLCGAHRPGHFDGVATVVTKLFTQTRADRAFFGEKDFQQLQVIRRLVRDLDLEVEVTGCPTIREEDGTAMSSRNLLLSDRARVKAPALHDALQEMAEGLQAGGQASDLGAVARARLLAAGFSGVDYIDLRACDDLSLLETPTREARLLAAAWLAGVRLIDNIAV